MENKCDKHEMVFVKRFKSNGGLLINMQCFECGEHDSKAYKKNLMDENTPDFSEELRDKYYDNCRKTRESQRISEREIWFRDEYNPYLKSEKWNNKRLLVLKRDNYLCQACLTRKATEIHHLTYRHVFNEPLFELVSICEPCHVFITKLDRE